MFKSELSLTERLDVSIECAIQHLYDFDNYDEASERLKKNQRPILYPRRNHVQRGGLYKMKNNSINARISDSTKDKIDFICNEYHISYSQAIERLIFIGHKIYLNKNKACSKQALLYCIDFNFDTKLAESEEI